MQNRIIFGWFLTKTSNVDSGYNAMVVVKFCLTEILMKGINHLKCTHPAKAWSPKIQNVQIRIWVWEHFVFAWMCFYQNMALKLRFSEKATKIWRNLPLVLTLLSKRQKMWKIFFKFCGFLTISWLLFRSKKQLIRNGILLP